MAKYSMKRDGKEVGPASVYAEPHNMDGKALNAVGDLNLKANHSKLSTLNPSIGNLSKAAGEIPTKTSGIETRGNGAATKGRIARGPMA
jgi:hypothetical protein